MTITAPSDGDLCDPQWAQDITTEVNSQTTTLATLSGAWTSYTPVWSSTGTAVSLGNGTITGAYRQIGMTVDVRIVLTMGGTTTYGTGAYRVSLPVTPQIDSILFGVCYDQSASKRYRTNVHVVLASATGDNMRMSSDDTGSNVGQLSPFTWAASDKLIIGGTYEAA